VVAGEDDPAGALGARLRLALHHVALTTERLLLRRQTLDDLDALHAVLGDAQTMSFYPRPFTRQEVAERWIERNLRHYEERGYGMWALVLKGSDEVIGQCGPWPQTVEGRNEIELGWHVNRRLWRRGYASEAAAAARDHAFGPLGIARLISLVRPENVASAGVARKIGMTVDRQITYAGLPHFVFSVAREQSASARG
jgi:ribosomal-protein-alanine N-acetyltransferase